MKRIVIFAVIAMMVLGAIVIVPIDEANAHEYNGNTVSNIEYKYEFTSTQNNVLVLKLTLIAPRSMMGRIIRPSLTLIPNDTVQDSRTYICANTMQVITIPYRTGNHEIRCEITYTIRSSRLCGWYYFLLECPVDGEYYQYRDYKRVTALSLYQIQKKYFSVEHTCYGVQIKCNGISNFNVFTKSATDIGTTYATLNGCYSGTSGYAQAYYEWGRTTRYGYSNRHSPRRLRTNENYAYRVTSLQTNTTYHFRINVWDSSRNRYVSGRDCIFTTGNSGGGGGGGSAIRNLKFEVKNGGSYRYVRNHEYLSSPADVKLTWDPGNSSGMINVQICYRQSSNVLYALSVYSTTENDGESRFIITQGHKNYFTEKCGDQYDPGKLFIRIRNVRTGTIVDSPIKFGIR